jgi:HK97 family phage portal protein
MSFFKRIWPGKRKSYGNYAILPSLSSLGLGSTDLVKSPTMAACIRWVTASITEAPLIYEEFTGEGDGYIEAMFPADVDWLNSDITYRDIVQQTAISRIQGFAVDLMIYGNALGYILRSDSGQAIGLARIPWTDVTPQMDRGRVVAWRASTMEGKLDPEDVVHMRRGSSQREPALGESMVNALREPVNADIEAARYMARALNSPSPSFTVSGRELEGVLTQEQVIKSFTAATSGDNANKAVFVPADITVTHMGFSPEQMAIKELAEHPQHAICSILGIPTQVLDVSAARSGSTYNNVSEASKKAARSVLAPIWETIAQAYTEQGIPNDPGRLRFRIEDVRALQEDEDLKGQRAAKLYAAGVIDRAEAKRILGLDALPEDEGWYASYDRMPPPLNASETAAIREQVGA